MNSKGALPGAGARADIVRQAINLVALIVTLIVNYLANALPINGQTTATISDRFPVFFVPAGYVFAIWGVIYLALSAFTVYQALPSQRANPLLRRVGYLFAATCVVNSTSISCGSMSFSRLDSGLHARPAHLADRHLPPARHRSGRRLVDRALVRAPAV